MNTTIGICTLLLGGWVLPTPGGQDAAPTISQPAVTAPAPLMAPDAGTRRPSTYRRGAGQAYSRGGLPASQSGGPSSLQGRMLPFAPTDPGATAGMFPFGTPTDNAPAGPSASAVQPGVGGMPLRPMAPPLSRGRGYNSPRSRRQVYRGYSSYSARQLRPQSQVARKAAAFSPLGVTPQKPFAGYRQAPALSPYMRLYSGYTDLGTIDPYSQWVKPELDQRRSNTQFGSQINGLNRTTQRQGNAIQTIGRETLQLQGITTPQYYMNYQQYYPGFGAR